MRITTLYTLYSSRASSRFCVSSSGVAFVFDAKRPAQNQSPTPLSPGVYRGLAPVVKFDISQPLRDMRVILPGPGKLRENEDRDIVPLKVRFAPEWDPVVQATVGGADNPAGTEIPGPLVSFNGQTNTSSVVPPYPNGALVPPTRHSVNLLQNSHTGHRVFGPAATNTLGRVWRRLSDGQFGRPGCTLRSSGGSVVFVAVHGQWPYLFRVRGHFANQRSNGRLLSLCHRDGNQFPGLPKGGCLAGCLLY